MSIGEVKNRKISKKSRSSAKLYNIYKKQSKKYNIDDTEIIEGRINY
jgi:hypothetical protein